MKSITIADFYKDTAKGTSLDPEALHPEGIRKEIGHFNVFSVEELAAKYQKDPATMVYNRREFFKISLIRGKSIAEYADKEIQIANNALLFATPKIPYNWVPQDTEQKGYFCIFTAEFLTPSKTGTVLDELPIFRPGGYPVFAITEDETDELLILFKKMEREINSTYPYKYDLIRNYVMELIHSGQKMQPITSSKNTHNASQRVSSLFMELLDRQFPVSSPQQKLILRTAKDYADRLAVHSNHLNKVLKKTTGKTTTQHITNRLVQEAKLMLRQTDWNISEIAYTLGFEHLSHFSNFFKKQTSLSPIEIRNTF